MCTIVNTRLYSRGLKSGLIVASLEDLYPLHLRETCAPKCAKRDFRAIFRSQLVPVDNLVSYPFLFIHLRPHVILTPVAQLDTLLQLPAISPVSMSHDWH